MTAGTSQKLADTLRAAGFPNLAERAEADEFHDYLSPHATPTLQLASELAEFINEPRFPERFRIAAIHIRQRLINGEFDASKEESDDWAEGPDGQDAFKRLTREESGPMSQTLGDAPIEPRLNKMMNALARGIDDILNGKEVGKGDKKNGFILMVFPFVDHEGRCNYISNARREDVVVMLKEQLARFEGQPERKGNA